MKKNVRKEEAEGRGYADREGPESPFRGRQQRDFAGEEVRRWRRWEMKKGWEDGNREISLEFCRGNCSANRSSAIWSSKLPAEDWSAVSARI